MESQKAAQSRLARIEKNNLNHERDEPGVTGTGDANDVNFDFNSNPGSSSTPKTKVLPDKYFCEGSPDKLMIEALKELNINDIKDFLMAGGPDKSEQFEKEKRAPPSSFKGFWSFL